MVVAARRALHADSISRCCWVSVGPRFVCRRAFCRSTIKVSSRPTCTTHPEASFNRTFAVVKEVEDFLLKRSGVESVTFLTGFSFLGQGQNTAQAFVTLKDWSQRGKNDSAAAIVADINKKMAGIKDAKVTALEPPPIDNLGNSSGFSFRLQDRGQRGYDELMRASDQLIAAAKR